MPPKPVAGSRPRGRPSGSKNSAGPREGRVQKTKKVRAGARVAKSRVSRGMARRRAGDGMDSVDDGEEGEGSGRDGHESEEGEEGGEEVVEEEEDGDDDEVVELTASTGRGGEERQRRPTDHQEEKGEEQEEEGGEEGEKAQIPALLLTRLLHEFFQRGQEEGRGRSTTRITRDANAAVARYMDVFVREAIARAAAVRDGGFLEVSRPRGCCVD